MATASNGNPIASMDSARRSLLLLGALLYPLSDEREALAGGDGEGYVNAVAARMRGVCAQSRAILDNSLKALTRDGGETKSRLGRRRARSAGELVEGAAQEVERILAECDLPQALVWLKKDTFPGGDNGQPLEEIVPLAARAAAAAVRVSVVAASRLDSATVAGGDLEQVTVVAGGTIRAAQRIAPVLDDWDMAAGSPTAIIGCPPPPGNAAPMTPTGDGPVSLGVAAAIAAQAGTATGVAPRRARSDAVWSSGGAVPRD